jgi:hypothetical protein
MSKISSAREAHTVPTITVTVCLSTKATEERDAIMVRIREAEAKKGAGDRLSKKTEVQSLREELAAVEDREREHMHVLRFTKMSGLDFANLTAQFTAREKSALDQQLGYNHHAACLAAAKQSGVELVDDKPVALDDEDWQTIYDIGSGWDLENIVQAVLNLNATGSARLVGRLKKD